MGIDYGQFYAGTSSIPSYGNSAYKKDTLVKYEFNTKDKDGNKVMDKMTREETIQAMKDISSQYGDNVIVEFSGDGMAALVENRKGQLDEAMTEEEHAAKAERDAAFTKEIVQNEHIEVAPEHMVSRIDYVKIMHDRSPETAEKMDGYMHEFDKTQDKAYLQKAVKLSLDWYKDNYAAHQDWFSGMGTGSAEETLFAELLNMAKEKKALLTASSERELFGKVEKFDWSEIREEIERKIVFKDN